MVNMMTQTSMVEDTEENKTDDDKEKKEGGAAKEKLAEAEVKYA